VNFESSRPTAAPWWTTWIVVLIVLWVGARLALTSSFPGLLAGTYLLFFAADTWAKDRRGIPLDRPPYGRFAVLIRDTANAFRRLRPRTRGPNRRPAACSNPLHRRNQPAV
jgi:hypothetical protein